MGDSRGATPGDVARNFLNRPARPDLGEAQTQEQDLFEAWTALRPAQEVISPEGAVSAERKPVVWVGG